MTNPWQAPGYRFTGRPWFVHEAILALEGLIQPGWRAFEWGSGSSTLWLGIDMQVESAVSIEHNPDWHAHARADLTRYAIHNVELVLVALDGPYATCIDRYGLFDLVLVDGRNRAACIAAGVSHLRPGGLLVLDNSERAQYQAAIAAHLAGWERRDYVSQGGGYAGWTTTVWRKIS